MHNRRWRSHSRHLPKLIVVGNIFTSRYSETSSHIRSLMQRPTKNPVRYLGWRFQALSVFTKISILDISHRSSCLLISVASHVFIVDRNECNTRTHDCQQKCVNEYGSFSCSCFYGYQLNSDNKTCSG